MTRYLLVVFASLLLFINLLAQTADPEASRVFVSSSKFFVIGRMLLAFILLSYSLFPKIRYRLFQYGLVGLSWLLAGFLVADIFMPEYFGLTAVYIMPVDLISIFGSVVLALLASMDLKPLSNLLPLQAWLKHRVALELQNTQATKYRKRPA